MRTRPAVLLILILAAIAAAVYYFGVSARANSQGVWSAAAKEFANNAYNTLQLQTRNDESAAASGGTQPIREFARRAATADHNLLEQLTDAVHRLRSDARSFQAHPQSSPAYAGDQNYLQQVIEERQRSVVTMDQAAIEDAQPLVRFRALWRATALDQIDEARELLTKSSAAVHRPAPSGSSYALSASACSFETAAGSACAREPVMSSRFMSTSDKADFNEGSSAAACSIRIFSKNCVDRSRATP